MSSRAVTRRAWAGSCRAAHLAIYSGGGPRGSGIADATVAVKTFDPRPLAARNAVTVRVPVVAAVAIGGGW